MQNRENREIDVEKYKNNAGLNDLKFQTTLNCHIFKSICDRVLVCICASTLSFIGSKISLRNSRSRIHMQTVEIHVHVAYFLLKPT